MTRYLATVAKFAALTFLLFFGFGFLIVGYSCFKHGDVGPYPEAEWADRHLLPVCMGAAFLVVSIPKGGCRGQE